MNKKIKLKLIIYIICIILPIAFYWIYFPNTKTLKCCWNESCLEPTIDANKLLIICAIISLFFTFLTIRTIVIYKNNKKLK